MSSTVYLVLDHPSVVVSDTGPLSSDTSFWDTKSNLLFTQDLWRKNGILFEFLYIQIANGFLSISLTL